MGCDVGTAGVSGAFMVIVGPDGAGKTTLARAVAGAYEGPVRYFHFRPPVRDRLRPGPPPVDAPPPDEKIKSPATGDTVRGWLRLARTVVACYVSYWIRIRPDVRGGALVIGDRWIFGYLTQPESLRYYGPRWLARVAVGVLPAPTLIVNLTAPVQTLLARKQELSAAEICRELSITRQLPARKMVTLSSCRPPDDLAADVLDELRRQRRV